MEQTREDQNKTMVLNAFDTLFNKHDFKAAEKFFSPEYVQHSTIVPPGRKGLFELVKTMPELHYENALVVAEGDYVFLHGRFTGNQQPRAIIAADILKISDGVLVEHWDVVQNEVTRDESKSDYPMFGSSFTEQISQSSTTSKTFPLTKEQALSIVSPLYEALNEPSKKDVKALLEKATNADYKSFHTNDEWLNREQLTDVFKMIGKSVPDLRWTIEDLQVLGDQIVVRGKATGTPKEEFWGAKPTGKSFSTMAIDIFTVKNGKLSTAYHVENWMTAIQQFSN